MEKLVVVTGATGQQGGSVVEQLLKDKKWKIRGLTRDPTSLKSQKLVSKGVEMVKADFNNKAELKNALQGAYAVFAVTNFWDPEIYPNNTEKEVIQGKQLADIALELGVKHYIWSSLPDTLSASGGKIDVLHFNGKNRVEQYIRQTSLPTTYVYAGFFTANIQKLLKPNDKGEIVLATSYNTDTKLPLFDAAHDTGKFVVTILNNPEKYIGKVVHMASEYVSVEQIVDTLTQATGKKHIFQKVDKDTLLNIGAPEDYVSSCDWEREYGFFNGYDLAEEQKTWHNLTTLKDYAKTYALNIQS